MNFFKHGKMLKERNCTNNLATRLIPKEPGVTKVEGFRPISLCNITYKIIAKCLAERLKIYLPELISDNQSAFVEGRKISDSILLAQELLKGFNLKSSSNNLQMDISKLIR